jgi:hypothetical protein
MWFPWTVKLQLQETCALTPNMEGQNGYSDLSFRPTDAQYINNKVCIVVLIIKALHVSDRFTVHHQES